MGKLISNFIVTSTLLSCFIVETSKSVPLNKRVLESFDNMAASFLSALVDINSMEDFQKIYMSFNADEFIVRIHETVIAKFQANQVNFLPTGLFKNFTRLKKLQIYPIGGISIFDVSNLISIKSHAQIMMPLALKKNSFQGLRSLEELIVSKIGLTDVENDCLTGLEKLITLDLSKNHLNSFSTKLLINCCGNLKEVFLARNQLVNVMFQETSCESIDNSPTNCSFSKNGKIKDFQMIELEILDLHHNLIKQIHQTTFGNSVPNIKELNLAHNVINEIDHFSFKTMSSLEKLFIESNRLIMLHKNMFSGLRNLKKLTMNHNLIKFIEPKTFIELKSLEELVLSHNNLKYVEPGILDGLKSLKMLDLSSNELRQLEEGSFRDLKSLSNSKHSKLVYLNLRNNYLSLILEKCFSDLDNLKELLLDNNKLTYFDPREAGINTKLNLQIMLHRNPWYCSCNLLPLIRWLNYKNATYKFVPDYHFKFPTMQATCSMPKDLENMELMESINFISNKCESSTATSYATGSSSPIKFSAIFYFLSFLISQSTEL